MTGVRVVNCRGKIKRFGRDWGQRQAWKKAYVTLAAGELLVALAFAERDARFDLHHQTASARASGN